MKKARLISVGLFFWAELQTYDYRPGAIGGPAVGYVRAVHERRLADTGTTAE
jgi:hypothetical protein